MAPTSLDNELLHYWSKLSIVQKEALIHVIKTFVQPESPISVEQYNKEIDEAVARVENGEYDTQEEVEKMAKDW